MKIGEWVSDGYQTHKDTLYRRWKHPLMTGLVVLIDVERNSGVRQLELLTILTVKTQDG